MNTQVRIVKESESLNGGYKLDLGSRKLSISSDIYNNLKSLMKNSNASFSQPSQGEMDQFLIDMSILHDSLILGSAEEPVPVGIAQVNEYLGSLIEDGQYPLYNDIIHLTKFLIVKYKSPIYEG